MNKKYLIQFIGSDGNKIQSEVFKGVKTLKEAMRISCKYTNHSFVKAR